MADQSTDNRTLQMEDLERLLENDENYCRMLALHRNQAAEGAASDGASSTTTTPGPLDTAFLDETHANDQNAQLSLSAPQSQTGRDALLTVSGLIDTLLAQQPTTICLGSAMATMVSTGTDPRTPIKMTSFGTMPRTPIATISIGTTPKTPTMSHTAATTTSFAVSANDVIDLCSPTLPVIEPHSASVETIDLCTPSTPTNANSAQ